MVFYIKYKHSRQFRWGKLCNKFGIQTSFQGFITVSYIKLQQYPGLSHHVDLLISKQNVNCACLWIFTLQSGCLRKTPSFSVACV